MDTDEFGRRMRQYTCQPTPQSALIDAYQFFSDLPLTEDHIRGFANLYDKAFEQGLAVGKSIKNESR